MHKILITGNLGYIGPLVCEQLRRAFPETTLVGFDSGFFADCLTVERIPEAQTPHEQIFGDVRTIAPDTLRGVDAVVHLAAISNDPMGARFEKVTFEVNRDATLRLAALARAGGVKRFIFASSCSLYGVDGGALKTETSALAPLTAYARSKAEAEQGMAEMLKGQGSFADCGFQVTALRFATACGFSARCRLDLALNDFVATALSQGEILLLSDGTPWRPLIHVADMARVIEWALGRSEGGPFLAVNAGSGRWNFSIGDLAKAVSARLGGLPVRFEPKPAADKRSYRVDFSLLEGLAPQHQPLWTLDAAVDDLCVGLAPVVRQIEDFRKSSLVRLHCLTGLMDSRRLDTSLRWAQKPAVA